jgi:hypothetical protein
VNITFDLETLGTSANAPIVQLAAVAFDNVGRIVSEFDALVNLKSLPQYGFELDYGTVQWWLNQDKDAIDSVFSKKLDEFRKPLKDVLEDFCIWLRTLGSIDEMDFWSHATFDPPILANAVLKTKAKLFIPYTRHRDIRTLTYFAGDISVEREGNHHNALDDCKYQASYVVQGMKQIKEKQS